jgi:hypothetical protein
MRRRVFLTLAAIVGAIASPVAGQETPAVNPAAGLSEWEKIFVVFSHPRCTNCHGQGEGPVWSGAHYGATRPHGFNVKRSIDGFGNPGLRCNTCHFEKNSSTLHGPPGAAGWRMPAPEMTFFGKSSTALCAQIKDPAQNGRRTVEQVTQHVGHDALIAWVWAPGPGREVPPGSVDETKQALATWVAAGAPCPER